MQEIKEEKEVSIDNQEVDEDETLPYYKISALETEYKPLEMAHDIARN